MEKERERNMDVQERHRLIACHKSPAGDLAHNPGMCPDWKLNQRPFGLQVGTQSIQPL